MRLLFFCLVLVLGSLQLAAAHAAPTLPEVRSEIPVLVMDFLTVSPEAGTILFAKCCKVSDTDNGLSVEVCRDDNDLAKACAQASRGLEIISQLQPAFRDRKFYS